MRKPVFAIYLLLITFVLSEVVLRYLGTYDTYTESIGRPYQSMYGVSNPSIYHRYPPLQPLVLPNTDFSYVYEINSQGIREKEYKIQSPDSTIRIMVTGDSFSEGMGAPYDSTWPHLLEKYLKNELGNIEVLNTGVAGNDPIYDYLIYRDSLHQYQPNYIIVSLNASDFTDYLIRGGFERINDGKTETFRKGPWFEPLYKYSRWLRVVLHRTKFPYRGVFADENKLLENVDSTIHCFSAVIDSFQMLVEKDKTKLIVLLYSTPSEIIYPNKINAKIEAEFENLEKQLSIEGIPCINIWSEMRNLFEHSNASTYTYKNDMHYNPNGYNQMALLIEKHLLETGIIEGNIQRKGP